MNLIDFLGWEHDQGIYRNEVDEECYKIVNNKLEIYDPDLLEWKECELPINEYSKLQSVEQVGVWREGFAIHNEEEWQLVKNYYLLRNYEISNSVRLAADNYLEDGIVFYVLPYYGRIQVISNIQIVKRDLTLRSIDWEPKFYAVYAGKANFGTTMYWEIKPNRREVALVEKDKVENWHTTGILNTAREWRRCGVTLTDSAFIPVENDK